MSGMDSSEWLRVNSEDQGKDILCWSIYSAGLCFAMVNLVAHFPSCQLCEEVVDVLFYFMLKYILF